MKAIHVLVFAKLATSGLSELGLENLQNHTNVPSPSLFYETPLAMTTGRGSKCWIKYSFNIYS